MQLHSAIEPKVFIGLDIHKNSYRLSIQTDLFFHKSFSMPSLPEGVYQYVVDHFPEHEVHLAYEAGCCGFHLARYLLNMGWHVLVVNPSDIRLSDKDRLSKTDARDAKTLSDQLKQGNLQGIHIPSEQQEQFTSLARHRSQLTRRLRQSKAQIKSFLLYHGIVIPEQYEGNNWTQGFIAWLKELELDSSNGNYALQGKIRLFEFLKYEYQQAANELRAFCRKSKRTDYNLLRSIPGIGGLLASVILAECGDLRRFDNERQFSSFIGLVPSMYNSGETERSKGLTYRCRPQLRSYLVEAAWVALRKDPEMQAYYRKHQGKNNKGIVIKVAHKLAKRILAVIKTQTPYTVNYQMKTA